MRRAADPVGGSGDPSSTYRGDIEGLRAVAVALVVLFHAGWGVMSGGYVGVDVFYVISGFLITGLLLRELQVSGTISIAGFYARRIRRLLPLSALVLLVTAVAARVLTPTLDQPGVGSDIRAAATFVANWHYASAATQYMADTDKSPVLHFWSLGVEEQFYVVWPIILLIAAGTAVGHRGWVTSRRRVVVGLVLLGAVSFALSALTTSTTGPYAFYGLHTRAWELAVGAGLALSGGLLRRVPPLAATVAGWTGILLTVLAATLLTSDTVYPGTAAAVPVAGTALILAAGARSDAQGVGRWLSLPPVRYLGRLSFALYLWHWPCLVLLGGVGREGTGGTAGPRRMALIIAVSLGLSVISHHLVENPVRRNRWLGRRRGRSLVLGALLTAMTLTTSLILSPTFARSDPSTGGLSVASALAARDDDAKVPRGCYQSLYTSETPHDCQFGDANGTRTVVLVGDSNAGHWFRAYETLARDRGWKFYFWGKSGCPTVDSLMWLGPTRSAYDTCDRWRAGVLDQLRGLGRIDVVVLARSRGTGRYLMKDPQHRAHGQELRPLWRAAAATTLGRLERLASHVVLMKPVPAPPFDVPACIADDPTTARHRCSFPRQRAVAPGPLDRAEGDLVRADPRASFLNLNRRICPTTTCPPATPDDRIIYLNRWHLTVGYSTSLWRALGRHLDDLLRGH